MFKHYRFVDPIWRAKALVCHLIELDACRIHDDIETRGPDVMDELETHVGPDLYVLLSDYPVRTVDPATNKEKWSLVPTGPFPYSRGTHLLDSEDENSPEEKNSPWKPDSAGGQTVAAAMIDGVSFCVIEECVPPDHYNYKRGCEIAGGRLRKGLAEMGIELPKQKASKGAE